MNWKKSCNISLGAMLCIVVASCVGAPDNKGNDQEILVAVSDSVLTMNDVLSKIPSGLAEEDSVEMFKNIVDRWVKNMILTELAQDNEAELSRINAMAEDYRNSLIIDRYLKGKTEEVSTVSAEDIEAYYLKNKEEMTLGTPLIKGVYLKISEAEPNLPDIRRWMKSCKPEDIDRIEKVGLRQALQYEYFIDRWVEWGSVADQIPYRFHDADAFLSKTKDFETSYGGSCYLLHVSDYLPSGGVMPEEYARPQIEQILMLDRKMDYMQVLLQSLYKKVSGRGI